MKKYVFILSLFISSSEASLLNKLSENCIQAWKESNLVNKVLCKQEISNYVFSSHSPSLIQEKYLELENLLGSNTIIYNDVLFTLQNAWERKYGIQVIRQNNYSLQPKDTESVATLVGAVSGSIAAIAIHIKKPFQSAIGLRVLSYTFPALFAGSASTVTRYTNEVFTNDVPAPPLEKVIREQSNISFNAREVMGFASSLGLSKLSYDLISGARAAKTISDASIITKVNPYALVGSILITSVSMYAIEKGIEIYETEQAKINFLFAYREFSKNPHIKTASKLEDAAISLSLALSRDMASFSQYSAQDKIPEIEFHFVKNIEETLILQSLADNEASLPNLYPLNPTFINRLQNGVTRSHSHTSLKSYSKTILSKKHGLIVQQLNHELLSKNPYQAIYQAFAAIEKKLPIYPNYALYSILLKTYQGLNIEKEITR